MKQRLELYVKIVPYGEIRPQSFKPCIEQHFSQTHFDASESGKNTFFMTSPKLIILIKDVLLGNALVDQNPQD
jgi:hypothetical protein